MPMKMYMIAKNFVFLNFNLSLFCLVSLALLRPLILETFRLGYSSFKHLQVCRTTSSYLRNILIFL